MQGSQRQRKSGRDYPFYFSGSLCTTKYFLGASSPALMHRERHPIKQYSEDEESKTMYVTPSGKKLVTVIPGDGIGPEVVRSAQRIIEATGAPIAWDER